MPDPDEILRLLSEEEKVSDDLRSKASILDSTTAEAKLEQTVKLEVNEKDESKKFPSSEYEEKKRNRPHRK